ncbi:MAG: helix-turn-helix transcriptional regulator [Gammaproteobacteria bacterium]|nr:helix-turn-helix transcriptional regulator [Gammaproteobacteria bacterium]
MKPKRISHKDFKKELLQDSEVQKKYQDLAEEYQLIDEMLRARKRVGFSQVAVAEKMHTTASVISRLESLGTSTRPSLSFSTLKKYAHALGCKLSIKLVPVR